ncbi:Ig-like domain-containing protein [Desulfoluna spongiiphila]|uniref:Ig-like domain-containing protein n=1 Tax=Desulfoluna spongiiphila TaxID=419481 RepID=UPI00125A7391|nr:Ig-like domain-containing protein [Desulfoluna spongiiphila]VVS95028.1 immunoglobulin-like fold [Desulfoluna spongiiphila]
MKSTLSKCIVSGLLLLLLPGTLFAWCWIRDTGSTNQGCGALLYVENCCDGNLRLWSGGTMAYHISNTTPGSLTAPLQAGVNTWNAIEMSTFNFAYQGTSLLTSVSRDGTNLISIDPQFATRNGRIGEGILAISTTWTLGAGGSYRAVESDIAFNGEEYTWGDGTAGTIDTAAVVAHESGHSAGLSHAGAQCQNAGSEGCGANFQEATMYWNYSAGAAGLRDKGSLELDDAAAMIHGYPRSTFTVKVENSIGQPIVGVTVDLLDAAAPRDGLNNLEGGRIYGDVTNLAVLMGDKAPSGSYITQTPFSTTDSAGLTNAIHPTHRSIRLRASIAAFSHTVSHTVADGTSTYTLTMPEAIGDLVAPLLTVTSHTSGQFVTTDTITLAGTASDAGRGDSGVQKVTVNGVPAAGGSAPAGATASWSSDISLSPGTNTITVTATDDAPAQNPNTQILSITYDVIPPTVTQTYPPASTSGIAVNSTVSVRFDEPMDPSSLTTGTFTNARGLPGTVSYDAASRTASFTPDVPLSYQTSYTFTLTTGVRDAAGNALASPVTWSFTTQSTPSSSGGGGGGGCFIQSL